MDEWIYLYYPKDSQEFLPNCRYHRYERRIQIYYQENWCEVETPDARFRQEIEELIRARR